MTLVNGKKRWKHFGKHYGYPKCCIDGFCNEVITRSQRRASNNTGFIPCKKHTKLILLKKIKLESLIKNRFEEKPFRN
jgi:hypothetical protein